MNEQPDFDAAWKETVAKFETRFEQPLDLQSMLFLIGLNELGQGPRKLSKDQKMDVLHIAVCHLLAPYGYFTYTGTDKDGWPHYDRNEKLPQLTPAEQECLMKEAIVEYSQEW